ncbi:DUF4012 domain-containing protein [Candidatus Uhrbacteria bacterium]|nr:DUF4012 domain-containing protein [Candidatus Uhrbacteria bacterium]
MSHQVDFLAHLEPEPRQRGRRRSRAILVVMSGGAVVLAGFLAWTAVWAGQAAAAVWDGRDRLLEARDRVAAFDFAAAGERLEAARASFVSAEADLTKLRYLRALPWVGPHVVAGETGLAVGRDLIGVLEDVVGLGQEVARLTGLAEAGLGGVSAGVDIRQAYESLSPDVKRAVLRRLAGAAPDLAALAARVDLAISELDALPSDDLVGPVAEALRPVRARLRELGDALDTASVLALLLPPFGGLEQSSHLLLLFMNNDELRPGGGFIGSYGVLEMHEGETSSFVTRDAYALDTPADPFYFVPSPEPLARYMGSTKWALRDSNWSPDFAVSAQQAIAIFSAELQAIPPEERAALHSPLTFQGVIGMTPDFVSTFLRVTGPIAIGDQTFTADNVAETLEYEVQRGFAEDGTPYAQRKEILVALVEEMRARLFAVPLGEYPRLFALVEDGLRAKQLALFSADLGLQEALTRAGWTARVLPSETDALMVVDANLASLKSDPVVSRSIRYAIRPALDGTYVGQVIVRYEHTGVFDWKTTRYRTYTRFYVPAGSRFLRASGMLRDDRLKDPSGQSGEVTEEPDLGFATFGLFISVEPGDTREIQVEYVLPPSVQAAIEAGSYRLKTWKQLGAAPHALTLDLGFGKNIRRASPGEEAIEWGDQSYRLNTVLDQDKEFVIGF